MCRSCHGLQNLGLKKSSLVVELQARVPSLKVVNLKELLSQKLLVRIALGIKRAMLRPLHDLLDLVRGWGLMRRQRKERHESLGSSRARGRRRAVSRDS